ncbi:hypothetical protein C8F04DRAFT_1237192 [Mycena alexandri]|uniref:Uncharacterized protein n=1 Tax=Mycena alexandri TaxID=1745969 RepID=A0AAD6SM16_9AGAR|nr:hypothetical protein C8F04DRAFT_1237192 [Mycena alexandri]
MTFAINWGGKGRKSWQEYAFCRDRTAQVRQTHDPNLSFTRWGSVAVARSLEEAQQSNSGVVWYNSVFPEKGEKRKRRNKAAAGQMQARRHATRPPVLKELGQPYGVTGGGVVRTAVHPSPMRKLKSKSYNGPCRWKRKKKSRGSHYTKERAGGVKRLQRQLPPEKETKIRVSRRRVGKISTKGAGDRFSEPLLIRPDWWKRDGGTAAWGNPCGMVTFDPAFMPRGEGSYRGIQRIEGGGGRGPDFPTRSQGEGSGRSSRSTQCLKAALKLAFNDTSAPDTAKVGQTTHGFSNAHKKRRTRKALPHRANESVEPATLIWRGGVAKNKWQYQGCSTNNPCGCRTRKPSQREEVIQGCSRKRAIETHRPVTDSAFEGEFIRVQREDCKRKEASEKAERPETSSISLNQEYWVSVGSGFRTGGIGGATRWWWEEKGRRPFDPDHNTIFTFFCLQLQNDWMYKKLRSEGSSSNASSLGRLIQFRHGNGEGGRALVQLRLYRGQRMSQILGLTGGPEDSEKQLGARTPGRGGARHEERAERAEEQGRAGLYVNDGVMKAKPGGPHCDGVHLIPRKCPGNFILDRREAPIFRNPYLACRLQKAVTCLSKVAKRSLKPMGKKLSENCREGEQMKSPAGPGYNTRGPATRSYMALKGVTASPEHG